MRYYYIQVVTRVQLYNKMETKSANNKSLNLIDTFK